MTFDDEDPRLILARKRFDTEMSRQGNMIERWRKDYRFAEGDFYNKYQWPDDVRNTRDFERRPHVTLNETRQHNLMIINEAKKNAPGITVRAVSLASSEAALAVESLVRHIEYRSRASIVYGTATEFQVKIGRGYARVVTDYEDPETMNQEILIQRVPDPFAVLMDSNGLQGDGSDARYAFIYDDVPNDELAAKYPSLKDNFSQQTLFGEGSKWLNKDYTRICEYYYIEEEADEILFLPGAEVPLKRSSFRGHAKHFQELKQTEGARWRKTVSKSCKWMLIVGHEIVDEKDIPSQYVPLVPWTGEATIIDGDLDVKGHTRALIEPQRMYNFWASSAIEYGALQSKVPWVAPAASIEGYETFWSNANVQNYSVLPFNARDDNGEALPPPQRPPAPEQAPLYLKGMESSRMEMMMVSGQWQAQMGQQGNERSGLAIQERQRQGDTATYHFVDGGAIAIRQIGRIVVDMIPKVYDTQRVVQILNEDGSTAPLRIDPAAPESFAARRDAEGKVIERILNPNLGRYDVQADVGPAYATKMEEAFRSFSQIITQAPAMTSLIGDLIMTAAQFPLSKEAAERLKRAVPKEILGEGPSKQEQALTQQLTQAQQVIMLLQKKLEEETQLNKSKDQLRQVDVYEAETKRLDVLGKLHQASQETGLAADRQLRGDMQEADMSPVSASLNFGFAQPRQGADGNWYVPDPTRPGRFLAVGAQGPGARAPAQAQAPAQASAQAPLPGAQP